MYTGKTVFSQVMDCLPMYEFRKCVDRYNGNYHTNNFVLPALTIANVGAFGKDNFLKFKINEFQFLGDA